MNKLAIATYLSCLANYLASDFFSQLSLRFNSIRLEICNDKKEGAATKDLIQINHFITTGIIKQAELLSLLKSDRKYFFE